MKSDIRRRRIISALDAGFGTSVVVIPDASPSVNAPYTGLTSHWDLEGNGRDYYYGLNDGKKLNGTMTPTTGKVGNCYTFQDGGLQVFMSSTLTFGDGAGNDLPFSYSFWIFPTEAASQRFIITKQGGTTAEYQVLRDTSGRIGFLCYTNNTNYLYNRTNAGFAANSWYHVVVTYDGSKVIGGLKIYVNGVDQAVTSVSSGSYTGMPVNGGHLCIGNLATAPTNSAGFRGKIDSVTAFPSAIAQAQIDLLYNSGNGVAITTNEVVPATSAIYERGMFVLAIRGTYQFGSDNTYLYWSTDSGKTWTQKTWGTQQDLALPVYNKAIDFAHIFIDGTVLFSTGALLWRSTDGLVNINAVTAMKADGVTPYTIHTPANAARPGVYFGHYQIQKPEFVGGEEMLVWGNYCNNTDQVMGAAPVNIWATHDKGVTVKAIYEFGQNPNKRDDGSAGGGTTGTLLGDAGNPLYCRHIHTVARRHGTNEWYTVTGDLTTSEIHWLKHTYDEGLGTWSTANIIVNQTPNKWFVSSLMFPDGGDGSEVYWVSDSSTAGERGLWKTTLANIGVSATNVKDFGAIIPATLYIESGGKTIVAFVGSQITVSDDFMANVTNYTIVDAGAADSNRIIYSSGPDSRGYYKLTLGGLWFLPRKTIFIKT